jgi:phosphotransferase system enzyme I (PtsI)
MVARHAQSEKIGLAICGEMAGMPLLIPLLLGMGFDELSMSPGAVLQAKKVIRSTSFERAVALVEGVLKLSSAADVRDFLKLHGIAK